MNFNMTFIVQMVSFAIFCFICMKLIWPVILQKISERQNEIQKSLESANKAVQEIELSKAKSEDIIKTAKQQAVEIIDSDLALDNSIS